MRVAEVIRHAERLAPPRLALERDPIGLALGDPDLPVRRVMVALDASAFTVGQAVKAGAGMLITHHPLLFRPLASVDPRSGTGLALALALANRLAVYSAHTNLDASPLGMNRELASLLGLGSLRVLEPSPSRLFKVAVFVPRGAGGKVREALFSAGAGGIGRYDRCAFSVEGEGSFRPGPGSAPAIGRVGREERVAEDRIETVVEESSLARALEAARAVHPYEEPAIDVFPLRATARDEGIGLVGELNRPTRAASLAASLAQALGTRGLRAVGKMGRAVTRVALCTGSGGSLLEAAIGQGAQLYLTGDLGYHHARRAEEAGVLLLDIGHFPPERFGMERFARALRASLRAAGAAKVEVLLARETDPFATFTPGPEGPRERPMTRRKRK